jgi:hypothetical protein
MKVSVADFEIHLMAFIKDIANVMPSPIHKFAIGTLAAANVGRIEGILATSADAEGMIDLDKTKKLIDAGFAASGDTLTINIPALPLLGLQSVEFKIKKADIDKFFAGFSSVYPHTKEEGGKQ